MESRFISKFAAVHFMVTINYQGLYDPGIFQSSANQCNLGLCSGFFYLETPRTMSCPKYEPVSPNTNKLPSLIVHSDTASMCEVEQTKESSSKFTIIA